MKVLSDLMTHDNLQLRTHVNGTLYSILTRQVLKNEANAIGLGEMLNYLIQNGGNQQENREMSQECDEQMLRQMQYIYTQLQSEPESSAQEGAAQAIEDAEAADQEDDDLEDNDGEGDEQSDDEIFDEDEDVNETKIEGVLIGEEWLTS